MQSFNISGSFAVFSISPIELFGREEISEEKCTAVRLQLYNDWPAALNRAFV